MRPRDSIYIMAIAENHQNWCIIILVAQSEDYFTISVACTPVLGIRGYISTLHTREYFL
jgi:hypothetical protein